MSSHPTVPRLPAWLLPVRDKMPRWIIPRWIRRRIVKGHYLYFDGEGRLSSVGGASNFNYVEWRDLPKWVRFFRRFKRKEVG